MAKKIQWIGKKVKNKKKEKNQQKKTNIKGEVVK